MSLVAFYILISIYAAFAVATICLAAWAGIPLFGMRAPKVPPMPTKD